MSLSKSINYNAIDLTVRQASSADGFLTSEELRYWDEHLKVPSDEVKSIPSTSTLLSLKSSREHQPAHTESSGGQFDLSEWTSWQNRLQKAHISGHSVDSVHMVELMEFMELQGIRYVTDTLKKIYTVHTFLQSK